MIWDLLLSYWMIEQHTDTHTYAILLMRDYESQQAATVMLPQIFRHHRKLEQKADSRQMTARRFGVVPRLDQSKKKQKKLAPLLWPNFI